MTGDEIRSKFLKYFAERGHSIITDSSLVPLDDPTLLFTNAGMVQFKRVFMGEEKRGYTRAVTCQRCVRAGGKHNDLENVGHTARHHTFFEMLGNFSFGDYFKKDAILFGWEFLTKVLGLPPEKLWVSVFEDDDEAFALWEEIEDLPKGRILRMGAADNFWAMGDTGPCGPCSEIHIDQGAGVGCGRAECHVDCDCDRYLELWNLVFMQFYRDETGTMTPLPKPSIDTGMGLERIAAVMQGKNNNFDSDLLHSHIEAISRLAGTAYGSHEKTDIAMRVIADHARATAFLVSDGVLPSNEGRGYVLRRIMRRAVRYGRSLGLDQPFFSKITANVVERMTEAYPHLASARELLVKVVQNEEERFRETLDNGLAMLHGEIKRLKTTGSDLIPGQFIFTLYDTFGFPLDIVQDVALEHHIGVDEKGFAAAMEEQRQRSKKSWKDAGLAVMTSGVQQLAQEGHKSRFTGYDSHHTTSQVSAILDPMGNLITKASAGDQVSVFCPETPFYAEAGGQIGDQGEIIGPAGAARVTDTVTVGDGIILHEIEILDGTISVKDQVELKVAEGRRQRIANNHTATHLLQAAMKSVLGDHIKQSGSLVTPDRLRFDFTHFSPLTREEITAIENSVNKEIRSNTSIATTLMNREQAVKSGATALFGEKYANEVRVVEVGSFSKELCGGTHVGRTGEIGLMKIVTETGIAAGIRRIEAVTGPEAFARYQHAESQLADLSVLLKTPAEDLPAKIEKIMARQKDIEKEISRLTARLALADLDSLIERAVNIRGIKVVAARIPLDSPKTLRDIGDRVRDKLQSGVVILGGIFNDKATLLAMVTKDHAGSIHAGRLIRELAQIVGGSGGGRPDMAQAGGPMADKLDDAIAAAGAEVEKQLA